MRKFWLSLRCLYYIVTMITFVTFPLIANGMPLSIAYLCYFITGMCGLLFVMDLVRG